MNEHYESEAGDGNSAQKREWEPAGWDGVNIFYRNKTKSHQSEVEDDKFKKQKLSHEERNY